jgi:hypothetical protein
VAKATEVKLAAVLPSWHVPNATLTALRTAKVLRRAHELVDKFLSTLSSELYSAIETQLDIDHTCSAVHAAVFPQQTPLACMGYFA